MQKPVLRFFGHNQWDAQTGRTTVLKRLRNGLLAVLAVALTIRVVWWSVEPIVDATIPALIPAVIAVSVIGFLYYRKRRW
jgi:hypothetical protein